MTGLRSVVYFKVKKYKKKKVGFTGSFVVSGNKLSQITTNFNTMVGKFP